MPTVAEILRQTGLTDEQIAAIPEAAVSGFNTLVTSAEEARSKAELAERANRELYDGQIAPALNNWGTEKANMEAQVAFYRTQAESAKAAGFLPADAPGFTQSGTQRSASGQFVANSNVVPGSPDIVRQFRDETSKAISMGLWAMQEYQRVNNGQFLPDDVETLANEASQQRMPFRDYVEKKYDFVGKRQAAAAAQQEARDKKIREEAIAERDKFYAERGGTNPSLNRAETSRFSEINAAVKQGERPDPLKMNAEQRRMATRQAIHRDIAAQSETIQ